MRRVCAIANGSEKDFVKNKINRLPNTQARCYILNKSPPAEMRKYNRLTTNKKFYQILTPAAVY